MPHWPQLLVSVDRSTHCPLHDVKPGSQAQVPPLQYWAVWQAWPHWPQLVGLLVVSTQDWPQVVPAHVHWPFTHESPCAHWFWQPPQKRGSLVVSTQLPLQLVLPAGHTHAPETQLSPGPHGMLQPPQLLGSVVGSEQPELHTIVPAGQVQLLAVHDAPGGQALPHWPQLATLEVRSTQPMASPQ
jgi:hypothetical protein